MAIRFLALILLTCVAYFPARNAGFIWDDEGYIVTNHNLASVQGLWPTWFDPAANPQFYPLVFSTFWVEYRLWGSDAMGYHVVNVLLHGLNSGMLWLLLRRLEVPLAWLIAAIFAVHPVHAESVVWISERKNVLSGFVYLSAFLAYLRFSPLQDAAQQRRDWNWYLVSLLLFFAALLSKTVTCSLPAVLILVRWWKRGTVTRWDLFPLLPMFVVGAALASVTSWVERECVGAQGLEWNLTRVERSLIAGRALCFYVGKLFWPYPLMFNYPRWHIDPADPWQFVYPALVLAVGLILSLPLWLIGPEPLPDGSLRHRLRAKLRQMGRGPLTAGLIFAGTLVPALGFVNTYPMKFYFVADHFQYLASIAVIALAVTGSWYVCRGWQMANSRDGRMVLAVLTAGLLVGLGILTWKQCQIYRDPETLWFDTAEKNPDAFLAQFNLGTGYLKKGDALSLDLAIASFQETERITRRNLGSAGQQPFAELYVNWGIALARKGNSAAAYEKFQAAALSPSNNPGREIRFPKARWELLGIIHYNLGKIVAMGIDKEVESMKVDRKNRALEHYASALRWFGKVLEEDPFNVTALKGAGDTLMKMRLRAEAAVYYRRLLEMAPNSPEVQQLVRSATSP